MLSKNWNEDMKHPLTKKLFSYVNEKMVLDPELRSYGITISFNINRNKSLESTYSLLNRIEERTVLWFNRMFSMFERRRYVSKKGIVCLFPDVIGSDRYVRTIHYHGIVCIDELVNDDFPGFLEFMDRTGWNLFRIETDTAGNKDLLDKIWVHSLNTDYRFVDYVMKSVKRDDGELFGTPLIMNVVDLMIDSKILKKHHKERFKLSGFRDADYRFREKLIEAEIEKKIKIIKDKNISLNRYFESSRVGLKKLFIAPRKDLLVINVIFEPVDDFEIFKIGERIIYEKVREFCLENFEETCSCYLNSLRPGFDEPEAFLFLRSGDFNLIKTEGILNVCVNEQSKEELYDIVRWFKRMPDIYG